METIKDEKTEQTDITKPVIVNNNTNNTDSVTGNNASKNKYQILKPASSPRRIPMYKSYETSPTAPETPTTEFDYDEDDINSDDEFSHGNSQIYLKKSSSNNGKKQKTSFANESISKTPSNSKKFPVFAESLLLGRQLDEKDELKFLCYMLNSKTYSKTYSMAKHVLNILFHNEKKLMEFYESGKPIEDNEVDKLLSDRSRLMTTLLKDLFDK